MKLSLALATLILLVGGLVISRDRHQLKELSKEKATLVQQARSMGIALSAEGKLAPATPRHSRPARNAPQGPRTEFARETAAQLLAFAKEMEDKQNGGGPPDSELQDRILTLLDSMMDLTPDELKVVIDEMRAATNLKDETRQGLLGFTIMAMAERNPQAALSLFTAGDPIIKDLGAVDHIISSSLAKWSKSDPLGALEWVRANGKEHPTMVTDDAKRGILTGVAQQDPRLAFDLLTELGMENLSMSVGTIVQAARTPEMKLAALSALREHVAKQVDPALQAQIESAGVSGLAMNRRESFESTQAWLAQASLTPTEVEAFSSGLHYHQTKSDTGQWIGWMAHSLPAEKLDSKVRNLVAEWTRQDFQAAGAWLAEAPDDAAKPAAVSSFAETVAEYEPETAEEWALTLPEGSARTDTLIRIYHRWPQSDPEGKAAFAAQHGIGR
jgi:hypothetical protein